MRSALAAASLAFFVACGGGSTPGTASSTGSGTGGTTTGATTTGGAVPLAAGADCTSDAACLSGICGVSGTGKCCVKACSGDDGGACGATDCDDSGACVYPDTSTSCGAQSCSQGTLNSNACDGHGHCTPVNPGPCPGNFTCDHDGGCNTSCNSIADCAPSYVCNAHACTNVIATGSCTGNDNCISGTCGINGTGHCCNPGVSCTVGGPCGATDCDDTGACSYPGSSVSCGSDSGATCVGHTEETGQACDGTGNCAAGHQTDCTPYVCGANACLSTCTDNASCGAGDYCDIPTSTCCNLGNGGAIAVDSVKGDDTTPCCGIGAAGPCQTISHAMANIDNARATGVTITATVNGGGGDWTVGAETYPIVLGWGVELKAAGVLFIDPNGGNVEIFDVAAVSANDTLAPTASLVGTAAAPVIVGMDHLGNQSTDLSSIQVENGRTLYLANLRTNGSAANETTAITVAGGGSLVLGQDEAGADTGTVFIGQIGNSSLIEGWNGIVCGHGNGLGCTISDSPLVANSVQIVSQVNQDLDAEDDAVITLSSQPQIGVPPSAVGFKKCLFKTDASMGLVAGILLRGTANVSIDNGTVQCLSADGFKLVSSANGTPTLTLSHTTIQNTEAAIVATAGTATLSTSTLRFNYYGVEQSSDGVHTGSIVLGAAPAGNAVICSSKQESALSGANPGVSVLNASTQKLDADNVAWDTAGPDLFSCSDLTSCNCDNTSCTVTAGSDGMDAVEETGQVSTANAALSNQSCGS